MQPMSKADSSLRVGICRSDHGDHVAIPMRSRRSELFPNPYSLSPAFLCVPSCPLWLKVLQLRLLLLLV